MVMKVSVNPLTDTFQLYKRILRSNFFIKFQKKVTDQPHGYSSNLLFALNGVMLVHLNSNKIGLSLSLHLDHEVLLKALADMVVCILACNLAWLLFAIVSKSDPKS